MLSVLRVGCLGFVVAILLLTVTARAYFYGPWPTSFVCTIDGPPGARVVRVDGQSCDHPVPHRVSRFRPGSRTRISARSNSSMRGGACAAASS